MHIYSTLLDSKAFASNVGSKSHLSAGKFAGGPIGDITGPINSETSQTTKQNTIYKVREPSVLPVTKSLVLPKICIRVTLQVGRGGGGSNKELNEKRIKI